jgi:hypothetical protein
VALDVESAPEAGERGCLTGFGGGLHVKRFLLEHEGAQLFFDLAEYRSLRPHRPGGLDACRRRPLRGAAVGVGEQIVTSRPSAGGRPVSGDGRTCVLRASFESSTFASWMPTL